MLYGLMFVAGCVAIVAVGSPGWTLGVWLAACYGAVASQPTMR